MNNEQIEMISEIAKKVQDKGFEEIKNELMQHDNEKNREHCPYVRTGKMNLKELSKKQLIKIIYELQGENDYLRKESGWI